MPYYLSTLCLMSEINVVCIKTSEWTSLYLLNWHLQNVPMCLQIMHVNLFKGSIFKLDTSEGSF